MTSFACMDPWTNPDSHPDTTVEAMSTRLEDRGQNATFSAMIERYLAQVLPPGPAGDLQEPIAVLDLGTGTGVVIRACAARVNGARLHGADVSAKLLDVAKRLDPSSGVTWTKLDPADGGRLPYADGEFDVIVMHTLLSHVQDPVRTLADAARCLKRPNGRLVIFDADHAGTVYGLPDFKAMMETNLKLAAAIATQVRGRAHAWMKRRGDVTVSSRPRLTKQADICRQLPRYLRAAGLRLREHHAEVRHARMLTRPDDSHLASVQTLITLPSLPHPTARRRCCPSAAGATTGCRRCAVLLGSSPRWASSPKRRPTPG